MPSLLSVLRQQIAAVLTATLPLKQMHPSVGTFTAKGECSRKRSHLALLRSALLILKLASLTADMDLKYVPPALLAPKAIWSALGTIADNAGKLRTLLIKTKQALMMNKDCTCLCLWSS